MQRIAMENRFFHFIESNFSLVPRDFAPHEKGPSTSGSILEESSQNPTSTY